MTLTTRQYLKQLDKPTLRKLFKICDLSEIEYWLVIYAFVEERMRDNTCAKLSIGRTKYHSMLNEALIKIEYKVMLNDFGQEQLALLANIMQVFNYIENTQQTSNDRILQELQKQNKVYLEEILNRLERLENAHNQRKSKSNT